MTIILALFIAAGEDVLLTGGVDIPRATTKMAGFGFTSEEEVKLLARSSSSEEELSLLDSRDMLLASSRRRVWCREAAAKWAAAEAVVAAENTEAGLEMWLPTCEGATECVSKSASFAASSS